jgi:cytidylate kinase
MLSSFEEKLKLISSNADELHTQELARVRQEMADNAEQPINSLKEHYETKMQADLEHFKSKSSLENESQLVIQSFKAEYESKIDDLRLLLAKEHNAEVERIREHILLSHKEEIKKLAADHDNKMNE